MKKANYYRGYAKDENTFYIATSGHFFCFNYEQGWTSAKTKEKMIND